MHVNRLWITGAGFLTSKVTNMGSGENRIKPCGGISLEYSITVLTYDSVSVCLCVHVHV